MTHFLPNSLDGPRRALLVLPALVLVLQAQAPGEFDAIRKEIQVAAGAVQPDFDAQLKAGKDREAVGPVLAKALRTIRAQGLQAEGPLKPAWLLAEFDLEVRFGDPSALVPRVLKEVPAEAPAWVIVSEETASMLKWILGPAGRPYLLRVAEKGVAEVRRPTLAGLAIDLAREGQDDQAKALLAQLRKESPGHPSLALATTLLAKERAVPPGMPAPAFKLADLDHPGQTFTNATFRGRFLLIDFWGTWCTWCVKELPDLHRVYAAYKDKGLEILSLAADKRAADVFAFRKRPDTPMPWHHAFIGFGKNQDSITKAFGIAGFPAVYLIGPDGRILAKNMALRGENLEPTLQKFIK